MSKYLIAGDSHWGISGCNQSMIEQNIKVWNYIFEIARDYGVEAIIECGDFLDKRKEIDANLLDIINKNVMEKAPCPLYMLVGNHNLYYRDNSLVNNISIFQKMFPHSVTVVDKFTSIGTIDLVPWVNKDNVEDITKKILSSTNLYCVGHFELNGFNFDVTLNSVFSTFANTGLCFNIYNYADFSAISKIALSLGMLLGRLEIFPLIVLFSDLKK